ncbi:MAG: hypothetical protein HY762_03375 [Planctomycetes bacterium]|nr:hypothetical protein [Planctomycetota bacterium]
MPFVKKFELKLYVPLNNEPAGDMPDRWAENLSNNAERIKDRLLEKIPDEYTFSKLMAGPSANEYANFVNPVYRGKNGRTATDVLSTKQKNMATAYGRWYEQVLRVYGNGATFFKQQVANAKSWLAERLGSKTLRFTGDKVRGLGAAPIAAYYLVGDAGAVELIRAEDFADGAPYDIARDGEEPFLKAAIQAKLVQGGVLVSNNEYRDATITAQNATNTSLLNGYRDTAKAEVFVTTPAADKSFCLWRMNPDGRLYLHLQVGLTV